MHRFSISIFLIGIIYYTNSFFIPIKFGSPFKIIDKNVRKAIEYNNDNGVIKKINGFYGIVGPEIDKKKVNTLYELFTGNGNIQGVFFKNGELTYVKQFIKTDKIEYEENHGEIPNNLLATVLLMFLHKLKMFPNVLGLANTAIININNKQYALFEQDSPYLINIDYNNTKIETINKRDIKGIQHFSAHSKHNKELKVIETIDYDALTNKATYYSLAEDFTIQNTKTIKTKYIPLVHDFVSLEGYIIFCDSPIQFHMNKNMFTKMPVQFHKNKPTYLHIIKKENLEVKTIEINDSFYIFHYAECIERPKTIEIYASVYEDIDYGEMNIQGRYRKLIINKVNGKVSIEKNPELEKYSLEFPVRYGNYQILLRNNGNSFNGFVICDGLRIIKDFYFLEDLFIAGEPKVVRIDSVSYLICFGYSSKNEGYLILVNLKNYRVIKIPIGEEINIGFHSIFI